ncbi:amidase domain-containing protein [Streptomyces sp. NPDC058274]|uniref:amidase domain-containing protein n=1 Tax=Streptomyces sp. NPDC058274 TaxID=3346416 RepID=UPI0036E02FC5
MRSKKLSRSCSALAAVALSSVLLPISAAHAAGAPTSTPPPTVDRVTLDAFGRVADAVLSERTDALVDREQGAGTAPHFAGGVRLSSALARTEDSAVSSLHGRKSRLAALGEAYSAADTKVAVNGTRVEGNHAKVEVTETTTLTYKRIRGDEPATTGFTAHHELTFTAGSNGTWQLSGLRSTDKGPRAVNEPAPVATKAATAQPEATPASTASPAPANRKDLGGTSGYNYTAMATYAEKYWKNYNPAYRNFNAAGGDCTNFVSQSLNAGGWTFVSGTTTDYTKWWYDSANQSDSWVGANEWSWFTLSAKRATNLAYVYQLDVGDVLQMDFDKDGSKDHTMLTTYRSSSGVPYVTYHATDTYRRSVASLISSYPNSAYYAYRT